MTAGLNGMRILITGAGRGLGQSHVLHLASEGADVIIHDLDPDAAGETLSKVQSQGYKGSVLVSNILDIENFQKDLLSCGRVDVLVNNAGVGGEGRKIEDVNVTIFDEMMRVHVAGAFFATKTLVPQMKARKKGKIINISSIFAQVGHYESSHYVAAKAAMSGLTKAWAREFAQWNITVNAVAPGFIETDMTRLSTTPEQIAAIERSVPLGRLCTALDISFTVGWLASSQADQITGQVISPNAGQVIA
jgi:3-oxoacyl-[acyl-carrier protein] reductase